MAFWNVASAGRKNGKVKKTRKKISFQSCRRAAASLSDLALAWLRKNRALKGGQLLFQKRTFQGTPLIKGKHTPHSKTKDRVGYVVIQFKKNIFNFSRSLHVALWIAQGIATKHYFEVSLAVCLTCEYYKCVCVLFLTSETGDTLFVELFRSKKK